MTKVTTALLAAANPTDDLAAGADGTVSDT